MTIARGSDSLLHTSINQFNIRLLFRCELFNHFKDGLDLLLLLWSGLPISLPLPFTHLLGNTSLGTLEETCLLTGLATHQLTYFFIFIESELWPAQYMNELLPGLRITLLLSLRHLLGARLEQCETEGGMMEGTTGEG